MGLNIMKIICGLIDTQIERFRSNDLDFVSISLHFVSEMQQTLHRGHT
jgi:hypothetical protein